MAVWVPRCVRRSCGCAASAVATDRREAADLALRAAAAHLDGGDAGSARRVLEGLEAWAEPTARFLELRVEVERRSDDPRALAVALDELAPCRRARPRKRRRCSLNRRAPSTASAIQTRR